MQDRHGLSRSLFMVTEPEGDLPALVDAVHAGVRGGVSHVVLRRPRQSARDLFHVAQDLSPSRCGRTAWKLLVHERVDVALAAPAQGVHLTLNSLPGRQAKDLLGAEGLLGISVHSLGDVDAAHAECTDYAMFGHVFETPSHPGEPGRGLDALRGVVQAADIPVIAIGGITAERVDAVLATGASGVAVISAISGAADPEAAARELRDALDRADYPHLSSAKEDP